MEVFIRDSLSNDEEVLEIDEYDTIESFCTRAAAAFGYLPAHVDFELDGAPLGDFDSDEPLGSSDAIVCGSIVSLHPTAKVFVQKVRDGAAYGTLPEALQHNRECALALIASGWKRYAELPLAMQTDSAVMRAAVEADKSAGSAASPEAWRNRDFAEVMVDASQGNALSFGNAGVLQNDACAVLRCVDHNGRMLEHASAALRDTRSIVLAAVRKNGEALRHASPALRDDREIVLEAVKDYGSNLQYASDALKSDRTFALEAVRRHTVALSYVEKRFKNDPEVVLAALSKGWYTLGYASAELRRNKELVMKVVTFSGHNMRYVDKTLQGDWDVARAALNSQASALEYCSSAIRDDYDLAYKAVCRYGTMMKHVSPRLREDKCFVLAAVANSYSSFEHVSASLRKDKDICTAAVKRHGPNFEFCGSALRASKPFVLEALKHGGALVHVSKQLQGDPEVYRLALQKGMGNLEAAPASVKGDEDIVLKAVKLDGKNLKYADSSLQDCYEVVLAAVQNNYVAITHASTRLQNNPAIAAEVVRAAGKNGFTHIGKDILHNRSFLLAQPKGTWKGELLQELSHEMRDDREVVLRCVQDDGMMLKFASPGLRQEKSLVLEAVTSSGAALVYAHSDLRNDIDVVRAAVKSKGKALQFASEALQNDVEIAMCALKKDASCFAYAGETVRADKFCALEAVSKNGNALRNVSLSLQDDVDVVKAAITQNHAALPHAGLRAKADKDLIIAAIEMHPNTFEYASDDLKADLEVATTALRHTLTTTFPSVASSLSNNRAFMLEAVTKNATWLQNAGGAARNDPEVVLAAVKKDMAVLKHAGSRVLESSEAMLKVVKLCGLSLAHGGAAVRSNRAVVLEALQNNADALQFVAPALADDRGIVAAAFSGKNANATLKYASQRLRGNADVVTAACTANGANFAFASKALRQKSVFALKMVGISSEAMPHVDSSLLSKPEFVEAVMATVPKDCFRMEANLWKSRAIVLKVLQLYGGHFALQKANAKLKGDASFVLAAVADDSRAFAFAGEKLRQNKQFVLSCLEHKGCDAEHIGAALWKDRSVVLRVLAMCKVEGLILSRLGRDLCNDREVVRCAVAANPKNFEFASLPMRADREIALSGMRYAGNMKHVGKWWQKDADFVYEAVVLHKTLLKLPPALCANATFMKKCVMHNGMYLQMATPELKDSFFIAFAAIRADINAIHYVGPGLWNNPVMRLVRCGRDIYEAVDLETVLITLGCLVVIWGSMFAFKVFFLDPKKALVQPEPEV